MKTIIHRNQNDSKLYVAIGNTAITFLQNFAKNRPIQYALYGNYDESQNAIYESGTTASLRDDELPTYIDFTDTVLKNIKYSVAVLFSEDLESYQIAVAVAQALSHRNINYKLLIVFPQYSHIKDFIFDYQCFYDLNICIKRYYYEYKEFDKDIREEMSELKRRNRKCL